MGSLRRYDVQARYAVGLAFAAVPAFLAASVLMIRNYQGDIRQIVYGSNAYAFVLLCCIAVCGLLSAVGCILGFNSAGQRRNDAQRLSWIGFCLGLALLTGSLILGIAFLMLRLKKTL